MGLKTRTKMAVIAGGLVVAMSATALVAGAQTPGEAEAPAEPETAATAEPDEADIEKCFAILEGEFEKDFDGELPQELLDELNQEGADLAAAFDAAGITYTMETDEDGVAFPEWDESDEAANTVADQFFEDRYGVDNGFVIEGEFEKDLPPELVEELNAEGQELAAAFDAAGIAYEMVTDPAGVSFPEWDWDDEAANEVVEAFFEKGFDEDDKDLFLEDCELPQELIDEINAEGADLAAALDAAGVPYELVTDEGGITFPEWTGDAGDEVAEEFFGEHECDDASSDEEAATEEDEEVLEPATP